MECPKCGYVLDAFASECPRCARMDVPQAMQPATGTASMPPVPAGHTGTVQGKLPSTAPLTQDATATEQLLTRFMPIIIGVFVLALAIIVPSFLKSNTKPSIQHVLCTDGTKYALDLPGNWGASKTTYKVLTMEIYTPRYSSAGHHAAIGMCGAIPNLHLLPEECLEVYLNAYQQEEPTLQRLADGNMAASNGTALLWAIFLAPSNHGGAMQKHKLYMVCNASDVTIMMFSASPDDFTQYEASFDTIVKSYRPE